MVEYSCASNALLQRQFCVMWDNTAPLQLRGYDEVRARWARPVKFGNAKVTNAYFSVIHRVLPP